MTYNFNIPIKELDGKQVANDRTLNDLLMEFIGSEPGGSEQNVKLSYWYGVLLSKQPLELDEPDKKHLSSMILKSNRLMVYLQRQLLEVLEKEV